MKQTNFVAPLFTIIAVGATKYHASTFVSGRYRHKNTQKGNESDDFHQLEHLDPVVLSPQRNSLNQRSKTRLDIFIGKIKSCSVSFALIILCHRSHLLI